MLHTLYSKIFPSRLSIVIAAALCCLSIGAVIASNSSAALRDATLPERALRLPEQRPGMRGAVRNGTSAPLAGPKIVFGSSRFGGNHDIYVMDLDGSNET